jgi:SAM-dependent methyltransferase
MNPDELARRSYQLRGSRLRRFMQSVPGQIFANPPVHRLHREMLTHKDHRVLEIGSGGGARLLLLDNNLRFDAGFAAGVEPDAVLAAGAARQFAGKRRPLTSVLADPVSLPFADASFDMAFCDDLLRFLDVRGAQSALREASRVLKPGALLIAWDLAPADGRFARWQRFWLRGYSGRIASERSLMSLAERSGFAYTREAALRPFFWPPIPRVSFIAATLPPGWTMQGNNLVPPDASPEDAGTEKQETG